MVIGLKAGSRIKMRVSHSASMIFIYLFEAKSNLISEISRFFEESPNKTQDAIQLATAIVHKAKIFMTNDLKIKNLRFPSLQIQQI